MTLKMSIHKEMTDIITCNQQLEAMIDECHELIDIKNPTQEDIEHCVREWWVGIR